MDSSEEVARNGVGSAAASSEERFGDLVVVVAMCEGASGHPNLNLVLF